MTLAPRALVLDATSLFDPGGDVADRDAVRVLLRALSPFTGLMRVGRGGVAGLALDEELGGRATDGEAVRRWLLGQGPRPSPETTPQATRLAGLLRPRRRSRAVERDATVVTVGLKVWADPSWHAFLRSRPDIRAMALLNGPLPWSWPEYAGADDFAAAADALAVLSGSARAILVPDEAARLAVGARVARCPPPRPRVAVVPLPSPLAGGDARPPDPALAAVPFFVLVDAVEARANTAFVLQLWRTMLEADRTAPRLVLAGERGPQVQEVGPLLDWNKRIAALVVEAPRLAPEALRHLVSHARAVLAPGFAGLPAGLLGDLRRLGAPVIVSDTLAPAGPGRRVLSPIDGPGWRAAIADAATASPPIPPSDSSLDRAAAMRLFVEQVADP